jgi:lipopolysaccharide transport system ATP-binding protein
MTQASLARWREVLASMDLDDGLLYLMDEWLPACSKVQLSWAEAGERLVRFEDLIQRDVQILTEILIDDFSLPLDRATLAELVAQNRFQALSGGRPQGVEDPESHFRKGVAGDWRHYFSDRVKESFKVRYGGHLIATGYESDLRW